MIQTTATESSVPPYSLPEDIIVGEILVRLPVKALFKLKCVSKCYNWIISDSKLGQNFMRRASSCRESWSSSGLSSSLLLPSVLNLPPAFAFHTKSVHLSSLSSPEDGRKGHVILGSSNGLVLSRFHSSPRWRFSLCVSNPLTKQWVHLPDLTTLNLDVFKLEYGIATSRSRTPRGAFLAYKTVVIQRLAKGIGLSCGDDYATTTVDVFSSDTGSWFAAREVSCPGVIMDSRSAWRAGFAYKGVFHWLDCTAGNVITYDPFDSPDRFGRIQLPLDALGSSSQYSSLINSGDYPEEMLRYCELATYSDHDRYHRLSVWRLVDSSEWSLERHSCRVRSLTYPYSALNLMVAPNPWNRDLLCHPFMIGCRFLVVDSRRGRRWRSAKVPELDEVQRGRHRWFCFDKPLIPLPMCPWSSPFYIIIR